MGFPPRAIGGLTAGPTAQAARSNVLLQADLDQPARSLLGCLISQPARKSPLISH
jgi:hypothetical protein